MISNVGGVGKTQEVKGVSKTSGNTASAKTNGEIKTQNEDELVDIQELIEDGVLKEEKMLFGLFKTGRYIYVADGEKSYADIKEEFDLADGALRKANYELFSEINGNADKKVPAKGTKIKIRGEDIKPQPKEFKDDDGNAIDGFYKSHDGTVFYEVQAGDTQESIYEKLGNKSVRHNYHTADVLHGYPDYTLQPGTKVVLEEKGFFSKLFSRIFD
ncbi:hypothetical protein IJC60_05525 [bacterium]|nr:hypothetical protein [bacterium]